MLELQHPREPDSLRRFRSSHVRQEGEDLWKAYLDSDKNCSHRELIESLRAMQNNVCAYCEMKLEVNGYHVDHIVPRSADEGKILVFENMALSCNKKYCCGSSKHNHRLFLAPGPGAAQFYSIDLSSGRLRPAKCCTEKTWAAINNDINSILGLNNAPLPEFRTKRAYDIYKTYKNALALAKKQKVKVDSEKVKTLLKKLCAAGDFPATMKVLFSRSFDKIDSLPFTRIDND